MDLYTFPDRVRAHALRALDWLAAHRWPVAAGALLALLAGAGAWVWAWSAARREGEAGRTLAEINVEFRRQYPGGFYVPGGEPGEPPPDRLIERYRKLAEDYGGTRAAAEARLRAADLEYAAGRYDAAIREYDRYAAARRARFRAAALLGKGYAQEAKGDLAEAEASFGRAAEAAGRGPLAAEAVLARGRVLEAQQKREEALNAYTQVMERFPQSAWAARAAQRAAALK